MHKCLEMHEHTELAHRYTTVYNTRGIYLQISANIKGDYSDADVEMCSARMLQCVFGLGTRVLKGSYIRRL